MTHRPVRGLVCIGSSAGGIASLKAIVGALPADFPWPILITRHVPADVQSHLPEILARYSALAVREAMEGERLAPGVVLTCPSGTRMGVAEGRVSFRPRRRGTRTASTTCSPRPPPRSARPWSRWS